MSILVHFVRHASHAELGHVLSGRSEIGLSAKGQDQARDLADRLRRRSIVAIHSSPCRRALETAGAIGAGCGLAVEPVTALDEIDFGRWTGRGFAELAADPLWDRWNSARAQTLPPDGESMAAATARAVAHVEAVAGAAPGPGPVAMVSHCDIIRGVIAHYLGLSPDRLLAFDVDPASISTLSVGEWGGRLVALNEHAA